MDPVICAHEATPNRRGVALILVLGFTALLLIVAFAFSVRMQSEYRTARLSHSNARTEPVMVQGLHLAAMEAAHYIDSRSPQSYWFYPRRERISGAEILIGDEPNSFVTNFLAWPADQYIPSSLYNYAIANDMTNRWGIIPGQYGSWLWDVQGAGGGGPCGEPYRVVAYDFEPSGVAYYLVNCSGYLDVHAPYGTTARGFGTNANEIQLGGVFSVPAGLAAGRGLHGRLESMAELYTYQAAFGLTDPDDLAAFFVYSRCPQGSYWDTNSAAMTDSFILTGGVTRVRANRTDILNAFERAGFDQPITFGSRTYSPTTLRGWLYTNLIDYMDTDVRPEGYQQPSQEPVANLNEVVIKSELSCDRVQGGFQYTLTVRINFELWNAYTTTATRTYDMTFGRRGGITLSVVSGPPFATTSVGFAGIATLGPRTVAVYPNEAVIGPLTVVTNAYVNRLDYDLRFPDLRTDTGLVTVDWVGGGTVPVICMLSGVPPSPGLPVNNGGQFDAYECVDPRFNWSITNRDFWVFSTNHSLSAVNAATFAYLTNTVNATDYERGDDLDKATCMYSANDETFETVGELGYLCYAPWRTVRLVRGSGNAKSVHAVVDTFGLIPPGKVTRGLVNPNTAHKKPLQAVFNSMPVDMYPGMPAPPRVGVTNAGDLAEAMIRETYGRPSANARYSTNGLVAGLLNVSQFGGLTNLFPSSVAVTNIGVQCEFERESLVRNCAGLFNTRNTCFTIILAASDEVAGNNDIRGDFNIRNPTAGSGSRMGSEHKAVSTVWRDPWTKEQFVRFFRHLPNDGALANY
jgi:hypothetical protein